MASPHDSRPRRNPQPQPLDARLRPGQPIQTAVVKHQLPVHTVVAEHEPRTVEQAFELVLQQPADLVLEQAAAAGGPLASTLG